MSHEGGAVLPVFPSRGRWRGTNPRQFFADFLARDGHEVTVVTMLPLGPGAELPLPHPLIRNPSPVRWVQVARATGTSIFIGTAPIWLTLASCAGLLRPIQTHHYTHAIYPVLIGPSVRAVTAPPNQIAPDRARTVRAAISPVASK